MAYVNVPKDLAKIKSKVLFNLTKRQLICFGLAALMGATWRGSKPQNASRKAARFRSTVIQDNPA